MKKILLLLLLATFSMQAQTLQNPTYGNIKLKNNVTDNSATKVNVQSTDGTINTISKSDLVNVVEVNDVPSLPLTGEVGKIYVVKNLNKIYRWNGTFYQELAVTDISGKINIAEKGAINGVATLGSDGKVPNSQIPSLAISETFPVSSQAQMLALSQADQGDVAIRSDISKSFILRQSPASILGNWNELLTPTSAVTSVNGQVGVVTLAKSDVGLSNVDNTSDANKPVSTAQQTALNLKENAFSKNTAFNKNFGTTAGTVAEGNDSRINNGQTAFGWGNHSGLYPTYSGTGATGTWGINISGSAQGLGSYVWNPTITNNADFIFGRNSANEIAIISQLGVRNFLGLGSNAYSSTAFAPLNGTGATGTWGINISGNAATWGGLSYDGAIQDQPIAYLLSRDGFTDTYKRTSADQIKDWLGLAPADPFIYSFKGYLDYDTNADDLTSNGVYSNTTGNGYNNSNFASDYSVLSVIGNNTSYGQVQQDFDSDGTYRYRVRWGESGFGSWRKVVVQEELDDYLPLSGGTLTGIVRAPTAALGTNTTQIATTAFVQSNSRPYKVYTALYSQNSTSDPTVVILENTLGTVTFTRSSNGVYLVNSSGLFTADKTFVIMGAGVNAAYTNAINLMDSSTFSIVTRLSSTQSAADSANTKVAFEIRVYN